MAEVIPFDDIVRSRRRRRERESLQRCLELFQLNLEYCALMLENAPLSERPVYVRRIEQLTALIEYGERSA